MIRKFFNFHYYKKPIEFTTRKGTPEFNTEPKQLKLFPDYEARWEKEWPHFSALLQNRLRQGHEEYGDDSFDMSPIGLIQEIQEEALDIVGWAFILYVRLSDLEKKAASPIAGGQDNRTKEDKN